MAVVLQEDGEIELTNTSKHCILHAVQALQPQHGIPSATPTSSSHKIDGFCSQLLKVIRSRSKRKRKPTQLIASEDPLISSLKVNQFYDGTMSVNDFSLLVERRVLEESNNGGFDPSSLHRVCWDVYHLEKRVEISFPQWLSEECIYLLWLIFNTVLEPKSDTLMTVKSVNEIMKRLVELCGYTWNPKYKYSAKEMLEYPEYLEAITRYFEEFRLDSSLICEVSITNDDVI